MASQGFHEYLVQCETGYLNKTGGECRISHATFPKRITFTFDPSGLHLTAIAPGFLWRFSEGLLGVGLNDDLLTRLAPNHWVSDYSPIIDDESFLGCYHTKDRHTLAWSIEFTQEGFIHHNTITVVGLEPGGCEPDWDTPRSASCDCIFILQK